MKKLILIIGKSSFQFDTAEELYQELLGKKDDFYKDLSSEEKEQRRYEKAYINAQGNKDRIVKLSTMPNFYSNTNNFYIDSDETYVLSLLNMNIIHLLEEKNSNIFSSSINKSEITDNYIILNHFADSLLKNQYSLLNYSQDKNKIL